MSLVSYWKFDDNESTKDVIDEIGNNNGISVRNTENLNASGKVDNAFLFNGTSDTILISTTSNLNFAPNPFSISFWIKTTKVDSTEPWRCILENNRADLNWFGVWQNLDKIHFRVGSSTTNSVSSISVREWTQVVCTYDNDEMSIYINGVLDKSATRTTGFTNPINGKLTIGSYASQDDEFLDGKLDELKIFDHKLYQTEINNLQLRKIGGSGLLPNKGEYAKTRIGKITAPTKKLIEFGVANET